MRASSRVSGRWGLHEVGGVLGGAPRVAPHPSPPHPAGINPCSVNNGDCSQLCLPTSETSRSCMCTAGYSLKSGQQSCEGQCCCAHVCGAALGLRAAWKRQWKAWCCVGFAPRGAEVAVRSQPCSCEWSPQLLPKLYLVCHRHPWRKESPPPWCSVPAPLKGCLCAQCSVLLAGAGGVTAPSGSGQGWNNNTALP